MEQPRQPDTEAAHERPAAAGFHPWWRHTAAEWPRGRPARPRAGKGARPRPGRRRAPGARAAACLHARGHAGQFRRGQADRGPVYDIADKNGGTLTPRFTNQWLDTITKSAEQSDWGKAAAGSNPVVDLIGGYKTSATSR